jgi:vacuolar protein sorting-associated protein 18
MVHYDVHYALRLCQEVGLTEACVQLSALLGLWTTAVDLALTISVDLAKQIAAMPSDHDDELRKKLWLKIGTIQNNLLINNHSKAMLVLSILTCITSTK